MDNEEILHDLTNFPSNTKINWSKFARENGIDKRNGGQMVKEFAVSNSIDVLHLEQKEVTPTRRVGSCKRKLPG